MRRAASRNPSFRTRTSDGPKPETAVAMPGTEQNSIRRELSPRDRTEL